LHCRHLVFRHFWRLSSYWCWMFCPRNHVKLSISTLRHCFFLYWQIFRWKTRKECGARVGRSC
jgi:hypothetical protein